MNQKTTYTLLLILCVVGFWLFENFYTPDTYSTPHKEGASAVVNADLLPGSTSGQVVHHNHFSLSYSEPHEQAEWVAYTLDKSHLTYEDRERPYFIEDPRVRTKSADWKNYRGSGYDRGHLCPAGDRRFSEQAYNETFYTSNISPQDKEFNAGIWNRLEQQVRYWAKRYGSIYVITGGVLEKGLPSIGDEDVSVPKYYYKIVSRGKGKEMKTIAFLMPHRESLQPLSNFVVSIDRLEQLTGIDFYEKLPNGLEEALESSSDVGNWKF